MAEDNHSSEGIKAGLTAAQLSDLIRIHGKVGTAGELGVELEEIDRLCIVLNVQDAGENGSWVRWVVAFAATVLTYQVVTWICLNIIPYPAGALAELLVGPFVFVYSGARYSPSNRYYVSISLVVIIILLYTWLPSNLPVPTGRARLQFLVPSFAGAVAALHLIRWQFPTKRFR